MQINRNNLTAEIFVAELADAGVEYAVLCPGSRNTPLIFAFDKEKRIQKISIIDERSAGFFALGIAQATGRAAAVVTTSGTAVAELYPSVIEAYKQGTPMIVCTADRPPNLRNCGANQTINQENIFRNHIGWYWEVPLNEPNLGHLIDIKRTAAKAVIKAEIKPGGPVHINFPFDKPLEPWHFTDDIDEEIIKQLKIYSPKVLSIQKAGKGKNSQIKSAVDLISKFRRGIIFAGAGKGLADLPRQIVLFSEITGYPIFAEGISQLRFGAHSKGPVLSTASALVHSEAFQREMNPEIIIQFGNAPIASTLLKFFGAAKSVKILVNEKGELKDPSKTTDLIVESAPASFIETVISELEEYSFDVGQDWVGKLNSLDTAVGKFRKSFINREKFPSEMRVVKELVEALPDGCNLMLSNSLPVRDWDLVARNTEKDIRIFTNRGASGIDGIISTALGIAKISNEPVFLVTGDLAFYHNISALQIAASNKINLKIVLINNGGGGIFEMLPVARERQNFSERFATPPGVDFAKITKAFGCRYFASGDWTEFREMLNKLIKAAKTSVLEIQTDARAQAKRRRQFHKSAAKTVDKLL